MHVKLYIFSAAESTLRVLNIFMTFHADAIYYAEFTLPPLALSLSGPH